MILDDLDADVPEEPALDLTAADGLTTTDLVMLDVLRRLLLGLPPRWYLD